MVSQFDSGWQHQIKNLIKEFNYEKYRVYQYMVVVPGIYEDYYDEYREKRDGI